MALDDKQLESLAMKAKTGDRDAFAQLYDLMARDIYRFVLVMTKERGSAEDVVSETFIRVWRCIDTYQGGNFRAYVFTIARNCTIDILRKRKRDAYGIEDENDLVGTESTPLDQAIRTEEEKHLYAALIKLSDRYREVVALRFFQNMSVKEVAELLERSESSVKITQHRALKKLRVIMKAYEK